MNIQVINLYQPISSSNINDKSSTVLDPLSTDRRLVGRSLLELSGLERGSKVIVAVNRSQDPLG